MENHYAPSWAGLKLSRPAASRRNYILLLITPCVLLFLVSIYSFRGVAYHDDRNAVDRIKYYASGGGAREGPLKDARNETLGFGEIMFISMPSRTDRQDGMKLLASYTDLKLTHLPGTNGSSIHQKAKPAHRHHEKRDLEKRINQLEYGCWRSHADAWQKVIDDNLETALILEDDLDWDTDIKDITESLSKQMRNNPLRLSEVTEHEKTSAPYGLDWDVLWLGHCLHGSNPKRPDLFFEYHDAHTPMRNQTQKEHIADMEKLLGHTLEDDYQTRVIMPSYSPICTMGYAVTKRGAQRLSYHVGYRGLDSALDTELSGQFMSGSLHGYTLHPPLFSGWRVGGSKDSDLASQIVKKPFEEGRGNDGGHSTGLRKSGRLRFAEEWKTDWWATYDERMPIATKTKLQ